MYTDANCIRAICYDESVYPDPHTYDPTRFLNKDGKIDPSVKDPEARVFGSGRRCECPRMTISRLNSLTGFVPGVISRCGCCITPSHVFLPRSTSSLPSTTLVVRRSPKPSTRSTCFGESTASKMKQGYIKSRPRTAMPFKCVVKPRSEKATKLINDSVTAHQG